MKLIQVSDAVFTELSSLAQDRGSTPFEEAEKILKDGMHPKNKTGKQHITYSTAGTTKWTPNPVFYICKHSKPMFACEECK